MNASFVPLDNRGFSLVEILIALVISLLVLGGIYNSFISQQQVYSAQQGVAQMQQNLITLIARIRQDADHVASISIHMRTLSSQTSKALSHIDQLIKALLF